MWKSTSELGYPACVSLREPPSHRADAGTGTTARRWRGIATPSRRRWHGDNIASMACGAGNLISTQVCRTCPALMPGEDDSSSLPPVEGQVKVNVMGEEVAIDADAYMAELREEVETLRTELDRVEEARRGGDAVRPAGLRAELPEQQMAALTSEITDDVL